MSLDLGLQNTHVLVTGAAGGIGLELVRTFRRLGARVTAHYRSRIGELAEIPDVIAVQADLREEKAVAWMFEEASRRNGGPVAVLVVNHGIWPEQNVSIADMQLDQWETTIATNLTATFLLAKHYLLALRTAPPPVLSAASIVLIGSTAGKFGEAQHGDYAASKAAMMYGLVPTLKNEIVAIAPRGRVNAVDPGWVATPMAARTLEDAGFVARALATTPLRKVATPADVAAQVAVLASPVVSGHVNGVNLMVDGGMEGRLLFPPPAL